MTYRNGNYSAFYVAEPFVETNLGPNAAKDFCYYNMLRAWKAKDPSFPFVDSHGKTYNVRDGSDWETTLKPRLRERLRLSKNIILFLSSNTLGSRALREEIDYGINELGLPVVVICPDYLTADSLFCGGRVTRRLERLWDNLPVFRNSMYKVPTVYVPFNENLIRRALNDSGYCVQSKKMPGCYQV